MGRGSGHINHTRATHARRFAFCPRCETDRLGQGQGQTQTIEQHRQGLLDLCARPSTTAWSHGRLLYAPTLECSVRGSPPGRLTFERQTWKKKTEPRIGQLEPGIDGRVAHDEEGGDNESSDHVMRTSLSSRWSAALTIRPGQGRRPY